MNWEVCQVGSCQYGCLSALIVIKPAHMFSSQVESRLIQAFICLSGFPSSQGGAPGCRSAHVDLFSLKDPSQGTSPVPMPFSPDYPVMWRSVLQLWSYRSSASFQLVFCEQCSTWRCIFDVFVRKGELHILLLCHLAPTSALLLQERC